MNRRYAMYLGVIALLALVNAGRWALHPASGAGEPGMRGKTVLPEDFRLRVDIPDAGGAGRNLFLAQAPRRQGSASASAARHVPHAAITAVAPPVPAEAESALGKLRLLGVVFHGGKRQAYLARDKENYIVAAGDTVFGQYTVDKITVDAVELRDIKNNVTRRMPVSGK